MARFENASIDRNFHSQTTSSFSADGLPTEETNVAYIEQEADLAVWMYSSATRYLLVLAAEHFCSALAEFDAVMEAIP